MLSTSGVHEAKLFQRPLAAFPLPPTNQCLQTTASTPAYQICLASLGSEPWVRNSAELTCISEECPHLLPLGPRCHQQPGGKAQPAPVNLALISWEGKWEIKQVKDTWKNKFPNPDYGGDIPAATVVMENKNCWLCFLPSLSKGFVVLFLYPTPLLPIKSSILC